MKDNEKQTSVAVPTRRQVLTTGLVSSTILLVPGCGEAPSGISVVTKRPGRIFNQHQFDILKDVVDRMIPRTQTPGAVDAGVHDFIDQMMIDWASANTRNRFKVVLKRYDLFAEESFKTDYLSLSPEQRMMIAEKVDLQGFQQKDVSYRKFKDLVYYGYETSQAANPDYLVVPGQYRGCLSVSEYQALTG